MSITLAGLCVSPVTMVIPRIVRGRVGQGPGVRGYVWEVHSYLLDAACLRVLHSCSVALLIPIPALCPVASADGEVQV